MKGRKKRGRAALKLAFACLVALAMIAVLVAVTWGHSMPVLDTHGVIADQERNLIYITTGLGLLVVTPVLVMLFVIAWKYRASNTKADYQPEYASNLKIEAIWWGIPCAIILLLAIITIYSTHALDPYKPVVSDVTPINIQVVSLQWRWLFIYPNQKIASINQAVIPANTPVNFTITADSPMNSFWVPALAGQVYAMSGMSTQLHVMADGTGSFDGTSANISGAGFADMTFTIKAVSARDFATWEHQAGGNARTLSAASYAALAQPSTDKTVKTFMLTDGNLYNEIIMKTMGDS